MSTNFLIDTALSYFPQGISYENIDVYKETIQFKSLLSKLNNAKRLEASWKYFLADLTNNNIEHEAIGFNELYERAFRIKIVPHNPTQHGIVLNLSKLVSFFCFYTYSRIEGVKISQKEYFTFDTFQEGQLKLIKKVVDLLGRHFPKYETFPLEFINTIVEDVEFEDLGKLYSDKYKTFYRPLTLYNIYFGTYMFY